MPNPLHNPNYALFRAMLVDARQRKGITQVETALKLRKPQSYVSKYERGERRLDFVEFLEVAEAIGLNVSEFLTDYRDRQRKP
jgi:transcriptional regulator with XRE-family HTH domain